MGNDTSFDLEKLLERLQNRHGFLQLFGKGLGYSALVAALPAYGSSSSSSDDDPLAPAPTPKVADPKADPEYTVLKRTSFGPHSDEMSAIRTLGITDYLEQQLNHHSIPNGRLEADIQGLFPLTMQAPVQLLEPEGTHTNGAKLSPSSVIK